ncbi:MAG TPA: hypothetical protein VM284_03825 [Candidatus Limnocylindria bacterium]|nr:hypothetical protein [Candidatus Limnocylindria bacterium]
MALARRLSLSSILALLVVFVLSTGVAAGSTSVAALRSSCSNSGGRYGSGQIELKVRATEMGNSGVTQINFVAWLEHQSRAAGGAWTRHQVQQRTTGSWESSAADHGRTYLALWDIGGDGSDYMHRINLTVSFLNGSGATVATHHMMSAAC